MLEVEFDNGAVFALENVISIETKHGEERVLDVDIFHDSYSFSNLNCFWGCVFLNILLGEAPEQ